MKEKGKEKVIESQIVISPLFFTPGVLGNNIFDLRLRLELSGDYWRWFFMEGRFHGLKDSDVEELRRGDSYNISEKITINPDDSNDQVIDKYYDFYFSEGARNISVCNLSLAFILQQRIGFPITIGDRMINLLGYIFLSDDVSKRKQFMISNQGWSLQVFGDSRENVIVTSYSIDIFEIVAIGTDMRNFGNISGKIFVNCDTGFFYFGEAILKVNNTDDSDLILAGLKKAKYLKGDLGSRIIFEKKIETTAQFKEGKGMSYLLKFFGFKENSGKASLFFLNTLSSADLAEIETNSSLKNLEGWFPSGGEPKEEKTEYVNKLLVFKRVEGFLRCLRDSAKSHNQEEAACEFLGLEQAISSIEGVFDAGQLSDLVDEFCFSFKNESSSSTSSTGTNTRITLAFQNLVDGLRKLTQVEIIGYEQVLEIKTLSVSQTLLSPSPELTKGYRLNSTSLALKIRSTRKSGGANIPPRLCDKSHSFSVQFLAQSDGIKTKNQARTPDKLETKNREEVTSSLPMKRRSSSMDFLLLKKSENAILEAFCSLLWLIQNDHQAKIIPRLITDCNKNFFTMYQFSSEQWAQIIVAVARHISQGDFGFQDVEKFWEIFNDSFLSEFKIRKAVVFASLFEHLFLAGIRSDFSLAKSLRAIILRFFFSLSDESFSPCKSLQDLREDCNRVVTNPFNFAPGASMEFARSLSRVICRAVKMPALGKFTPAEILYDIFFCHLSSRSESDRNKEIEVLVDELRQSYFDALAEKNSCELTTLQKIIDQVVEQLLSQLSVDDKGLKKKVSHDSLTKKLYTFRYLKALGAISDNTRLRQILFILLDKEAERGEGVNGKNGVNLIFDNAELDRIKKCQLQIGDIEVIIGKLIFLCYQDQNSSDKSASKKAFEAVLSYLLTEGYTLISNDNSVEPSDSVDTLSTSPQEKFLTPTTPIHCSSSSSSSASSERELSPRRNASSSSSSTTSSDDRKSSPRRGTSCSSSSTSVSSAERELSPRRNASSSSFSTTSSDDRKSSPRRGTSCSSSSTSVSSAERELSPRRAANCFSSSSSSSSGDKKLSPRRGYLSTSPPKVEAVGSDLTNAPIVPIPEGKEEYQGELTVYLVEELLQAWRNGAEGVGYIKCLQKLHPDFSTDKRTDCLQQVVTKIQKKTGFERLIKNLEQAYIFMSENNPHFVEVKNLWEWVVRQPGLLNETMCNNFYNQLRDKINDSFQKGSSGIGRLLTLCEKVFFANEEKFLPDFLTKLIKTWRDCKCLFIKNRKGATLNTSSSSSSSSNQNLKKSVLNVSFFTNFEDNLIKACAVIAKRFSKTDGAKRDLALLFAEEAFKGFAQKMPVEKIGILEFFDRANICAALNENMVGQVKSFWEEKMKAVIAGQIKFADFLSEVGRRVIYIARFNTSLQEQLFGYFISIFSFQQLSDDKQIKVLVKDFFKELFAGSLGEILPNFVRVANCLEKNKNNGPGFFGERGSRYRWGVIFDFAKEVLIDKFKEVKNALKSIDFEHLDDEGAYNAVLQKLQSLYSTTSSSSNTHSR
jgi:hypothetical protein